MCVCVLRTSVLVSPVSFPCASMSLHTEIRRRLDLVSVGPDLVGQVGVGRYVSGDLAPGECVELVLKLIPNFCGY